MADESECNTGKKAISRCMRAWNYAYKKETARHRGEPNHERANQAANAAYLRAMPVLAGYKHICDFIACVNFASTAGIVTPIEAQHFLTNAKIAISVVCHHQASSSGTMLLGPSRLRRLQQLAALEKNQGKNHPLGRK